jgi:hypothetical protein
VNVGLERMSVEAGAASAGTPEEQIIVRSDLTLDVHAFLQAHIKLRLDYSSELDSSLSSFFKFVCE